MPSARSRCSGPSAPFACANTPPPLRRPSPGIRALWESGEWQSLLGAPDLAASPLMAAPAAPAAPPAGAGARRGLLDAVLALSVTQDVLMDADAHLPAVPEEEEEARALAFEFYSARRTQLAALPRELLARVASCARGCEEGADMWEVLAPLRAVRPVNGGLGYDEALVVQLRGTEAIYLDVGGGSEEEGGGGSGGKEGDDEAREDAANNAAAAAA
jgi:alkylhydroperoxidase family enzyme